MSSLKNMQIDRNGFGKDYLVRHQTKINQWKRLLNSRKHQNVLLKNKLSSILKDKYDQTLLISLEEFQSEFIGEDVVIDSLRKDINVLESLLVMMPDAERPTKKAIITTIQRIDSDISESTTRFRNLKASFNDFRHKIFNRQN